jgi:uncharacterized protein YqgC (DUF456 family)
MTELALAAAVVLLVAAVAASFVPLVPGGLLSLLGVVGYWWATGWTEPGVAFVAAATLVSLAVLVVDWLAGAVSAKAGGAATSTSILAGVAGLVLFVVLSPVGGLLAVLVIVFGVEVYRGAAPADGAKAAVVTAVGMLASNVVQALLTGAVLVAFLEVTVL